MTRPSKRLRAVAFLGVAGLVLTMGGAPRFTSGADHLDAPSLGSIHVDPDDTLHVSKANGPLDINDLYVFKAAASGRTVLALTVNPAINLLGPTTFAANGAYNLNVDLNGNAVADLVYTVTFGDPDARGIQHYVVKANGRAVASGFTGAKGKSQSREGVMAFAGPRSDPFFFDLLGFLGSVKSQGTRRLDDGRQSDFFIGLNTLGIVVEVPNWALGGDGHQIGVWATTASQDTNGVWHQADQIGRPAINTVFNAAIADKEAFNTTPPALQRTAMSHKFRNNVIGVLKFFSSLDNEGAYSDAQAAALADVLLPDLLTYQVGSPAAGPLNGRGLDNDVIDAELNIVTGGYPFADRPDGTGAIPTDMVGPHHDYLPSFPYLGNPH